MARAQKAALRPFSPEERAALLWLKTASSERVDTVRRATALLAVAAGSALTAAATQAGLRSTSTVTNLVGRFNRQGLAAVRVAAGRGRTPTPAARSSPGHSGHPTGSGTGQRPGR